MKDRALNHQLTQLESNPNTKAREVWVKKLYIYAFIYKIMINVAETHPDPRGGRIYAG